MIHDCPSCGARNRLPASRLSERARCGSCKAQLSPPGSPLRLSTAAEFEELVATSPLPVLVDFWASWCAPCRMVAPELEKLARTRAGQLVVAKVDVDEVQETAARYGIKGVPTMVLFRGGKEARRASGAMPADAIASTLAL